MRVNLAQGLLREWVFTLDMRGCLGSRCSRRKLGCERGRRGQIWSCGRSVWYRGVNRSRTGWSTRAVFLFDAAVSIRALLPKVTRSLSGHIRPTRSIHLDPGPGLCVFVPALATLNDRPLTREVRDTRHGSSSENGAHSYQAGRNMWVDPHRRFGCIWRCREAGDCGWRR